jgi:hypothetical protein
VALREPALIFWQVLDSAQAGGPDDPPLLLRALLALIPQRALLAATMATLQGYPSADRDAVRAEILRLGKAGIKVQLAAHAGHDLRAALSDLRAPTRLFAGPLTCFGQAERCARASPAPRWSWSPARATSPS